MKREIISISALILLLGTAQVARATLVDSNSIIQDGVEYYLQTDKFVYELGEDVVMLYRVTNLTENPVDIGKVVERTEPAWYHFVITVEAGNQVRDYPRVIPGLGPQILCLQPYESIEHEQIWNMMNDNGTSYEVDDFPVGPGIYNVMGELLLLYGDQDKRVPVSVSIEIIPEPTTLALLGIGFIGMILRKKGRYVRWKRNGVQDYRL